MKLIKAEVNFDKSTLITVKHCNVEYVAMRSIVEGIGLDWTGQRKKLNAQKDKFSCRHISSTASDGKKYKMLCIPLKKLNGWLFSINPEKVRESLRDKLIKYQEECFTALHDYWVNGSASRKHMNLSVAEIEAHDIARYDSLTFRDASQGSNSMLKRKLAKKVITQRIKDWEEKYQLKFNYQLIDTGLRITTIAA